MLAIINAELILRDHLFPEAVLLIDGDKIADYGPMRTTPMPERCEIVDAKGAYVGPGFVDIHTHAFRRVEFFQDPIYVAQSHLKYGTTTIQPTLYFKLDKQRMIDALHLIRDAMKQPEGRNMVGIYVEGPYMNPDYGSSRENCPWAKDIDPDDYLPVLEAAGDAVKVWTLAPEREHIDWFVRDAKKANPGVLFAVGHSEAEPHHIEPFLSQGLCLGTHHTNATGTIIKYPECRGVCVDETVSYNDSIYAEIISDSQGIHVDPYMQRLIRKIKGDDKVILISDASAGTGEALPGLEHITDINFDHAGEIDGSNMTLNVGVRNFMVHTGASLVEAFRMATYNPCRVMGYTDRGEIAVGKLADLVIVDDRVNVKKVIFKGQIL